MDIIRCGTKACRNCDLPESKMMEIVDAVRGGGLVVYPTETLYGLGANAMDENAVKKVYMIKRRPFDMPLSVAVSDLNMIEEIAVLDHRARRLVERFMPGPLTILLTKRDIIPDILTSASTEVGVRMPDHPFALKLIARTGPITSTSANLHARPNPVSAQQAIDDLGEAVPYYVDCGPTIVGKPSTIIQFTEGSFEVIRAGAIPVPDIEAVLDE